MLSHPTLEAEADEVITGVEPSYKASVFVDWDRDGSYDHPLSDLSEFLIDVSIDRSLKGSAPEEILLIEGASAAELILTITGEHQGVSLASVFSPFNPGSIFYTQEIMGVDVIVWIGAVTDLGVAYYKQFTGQIRTIDPDRGSDTVKITALDRVEKLRRPVMLPPWAMSEQHVSYGEDDSQLVHSHWVIDHCLRWCDTSPTPYRPNYRSETGLSPDSAEGPQFFLTGNGSYVPSLGWMDNLNASAFPSGEVGDPMYAQNGPLHPNAPAGSPVPLSFAAQGETAITTLPLTPASKGVTRYWIADRDTQYVTHYVGFTLNGPEHQGIAQHNVMEIRTGGKIELRVQIDTGSIRGQVFNLNTATVDLVSDWITIPTGVDHVDCFIQWDNSPASGGRMYVQAGGNDNGGMVDYGSEIPPGSYDQIQGRISVAQALSLSDVFYASRNYQNSTPNVNEALRPARYTASLDQGLNRFSHMPTRQDDAWNVITEVAAAELGSVFWDEQGRFHFWNYQHVLDLQDEAPVREIHLDDVTGLKVSNTLDSVRNIYTAKLTRKRSKGIIRVYESQDEWEFYVPALTEKKFTLWLDDVLSPLTFLMAKHTDTDGGSPFWDDWTDDVNHGYCVQYEVAGVWAKDDSKAQVDIYVYYNAAGYLTVRVWNGNADPIRLADGSGKPAFRLAGTKVLSSYDGLPITVRDQDSIDTYDPRNLTLDGDWYQDALSQYDLIGLLLGKTTKPSPATDSISVVGDVRVQLGDCTRVVDPEGFGDMTLQIYGINRRWGLSGGLSDRYTVEVIRPPAVGIWDSPTAGLWDSTFVWSA